MKRLLSFLLLPVLCFMLVGCGKTTDSGDGDKVVNGSDTDPGIEGYVVKKDDSRILVVSSVPKDFSSTGGMNEFYNAIWFSKAPEKVELGDKVQVWFDIVLESYPGQSEAMKVVIFPSKKPQGADLTEAEAIRIALGSGGIDPMGVPVIKDVKFNSQADSWDVIIRQNEQEGDLKVVVPDK